MTKRTINPEIEDEIMHSRLLFVALPATFVFFACSSEPASSSDSSATSPSPTSSSSGDGAACGKAGRTGVTDCRVDCNAGQYCDKYLYCQPGCTSDANCGEAERCVKCAGESIGTCQACDVTREDACKLPGAPSPGPTPSLCQRDTTFDFDCAKASAKRAYSCPTNEEPPGCVASPSGDPTVWCCAE